MCSFNRSALTCSPRFARLVQRVLADACNPVMQFAQPIASYHLATAGLGVGLFALQLLTAYAARKLFLRAHK